VVGPVTGYRQDGVLSDGSRLSGPYTFDADLGSFSNFSDISVTSSFGDSYSLVNPQSSGGPGLLTFVGDPPVNGGPAMAAQLAEDMTNAGGTIAILPGFLFSGGTGFSIVGECTGNVVDCSGFNPAGVRDIASGFVTTVSPIPLPAGVVLLIGAVGALGAMRARRRG